jgi:uncharacterized OsmC-like protein
MIIVKEKERPTGAKATLGRVGHGDVVSATGAKLAMSASASAPGYSPLDLMYAALAGCLVLSLRVAASEKRLLDRFVEARVAVTGRKAKDGTRRVTHLDIAVEIDGTLTEAEKKELIARAEELCTVSTALKNSPEFVVNGGQA